LIACVCVAWLVASPVLAQDSIGEARRLYNAAQYDAAERAARAALSQPRAVNSARVVLGRILLERYRLKPSPPLLVEARDTLRSVSADSLDPRERLELMLGLGEVLFLEERFAAAAEIFEPVVAPAIALGAPAHDRALDWWATALDRHAATRPFAERGAIYDRITTRMTNDLNRDPGSAPANYWLVAAAHGRGDLDGAWSAAQAAWIRAGFAGVRTKMLRADIDRLVMEGVIPARAARITGREPNLVVAGLVGDWEAFKTAYTR
jgi:hypothetical protein